MNNLLTEHLLAALSDQKNSETDPVVKSLLENSNRLFRDAVILYNHNRYPTALSLSILALEEFGKYLLLKSNKVAKNNSHIVKQLYATSYLLAESVKTGLEKKYTFSPRGSDWDPEHKKVEEDLAEKLAKDISEIFQDAYRNLAANNYLSAALNRLKKRGLYLDIKSHQIVSSPNSITQSECKAHMDIISALLNQPIVEEIDQQEVRQPLIDSLS